MWTPRGGRGRRAGGRRCRPRTARSTVRTPTDQAPQASPPWRRPASARCRRRHCGVGAGRLRSGRRSQLDLDAVRPDVAPPPAATSRAAPPGGRRRFRRPGRGRRGGVDRAVGDVPAPRHGLDARRRCRCGPAGCRRAARQASPRRGGRPAAPPRRRSSPVPWSSRATATRSPVATHSPARSAGATRRDIPLCTVGVGFPGQRGRPRPGALPQRHAGAASSPRCTRTRAPATASATPTSMRVPASSTAGRWSRRRARPTSRCSGRTWCAPSSTATCPHPGRSAASPVRTASRRASPRRPGRLAVLQRCPDEPADRLTVLIPDGAEADKPQEEFSVPLTGVERDAGRGVRRPGGRRAARPSAAGGARPLGHPGGPRRPRRPRRGPGSAAGRRRGRRDHGRRPRVLVDGLAHRRAERPRPHPRLDARRHARPGRRLRR